MSSVVNILSGPEGVISDDCAKMQRRSPGFVLSFDESCTHRRGAKECVVVFTGCHLKRIVDIEIVERPRGYSADHYDGSSHGMEVDGLRSLTPRWIDNAFVIGCGGDSDNKAIKAIRDANCDIQRFFDPNHISKCSDRK
jgi:hypothetical protein